MPLQLTMIDSHKEYENPTTEIKAVLAGIFNGGPTARGGQRASRREILRLPALPALSHLHAQSRALYCERADEGSGRGIAGSPDAAPLHRECSAAGHRNFHTKVRERGVSRCRLPIFRSIFITNWKCQYTLRAPYRDPSNFTCSFQIDQSQSLEVTISSPSLFCIGIL